MYYLIYQITNKLNGKIYIGQHKTENKDDGYMGSGVLIRLDEEKYGLENFEKTILFECSSFEEMNQKERELVNEEFVKRDDTYNLAIGGQGGWCHTNEMYTTEMHSKAGLKAIMNFLEKHNYSSWKEYSALNAGKWLLELSEEEYKAYCKKISDGLKKYYETHPGVFFGKHHSEKTKQQIGEKVSKYQSGTGNSNYGKHWYYNLDTKENHSYADNETIPDGWIKGRYVSDEFKKKCSLISKNRVHIHKGNQHKFLDKSQVQQYLDDGWTYGRNDHPQRNPPKFHRHKLSEEEKQRREAERLKRLEEKNAKIEYYKKTIPEQYEYFKDHTWDEFKVKYPEVTVTKTYFMELLRTYVPDKYQKRYSKPHTWKNKK